VLQEDAQDVKGAGAQLDFGPLAKQARRGEIDDKRSDGHFRRVGCIRAHLSDIGVFGAHGVSEFAVFLRNRQDTPSKSPPNGR
jgi:hypothetical protein